MNRSDIGFSVSSEPRQKIDVETSDLALGEAVLLAINASKDNVPTPSDFKAFSKDFLKFFGAKSLKSFGASASLCSVVVIGTDAEIQRHIHNGKGHFLPDDDKKIICPIEPNTIGRSLRAVFGLQD